MTQPSFTQSHGHGAPAPPSGRMQTFQFTHHHSLPQPQMMMGGNGCHGMRHYDNNNWYSNNNSSMMQGYNNNNSSMMQGYTNINSSMMQQGYNNNLSMMQNPGAAAFGYNSNLSMMQNPGVTLGYSNNCMPQNTNQSSSSRQPHAVIREYERACIGAHHEKWLSMWREAYNIICLNGGSIIGGHNGYPALAQWFNSQKQKFWTLSDVKQELLSMLGLP